jgi:23S rRNA U2552 (ribose-2'-O)-methylase RlmE/FtsJ
MRKIILGVVLIICLVSCATNTSDIVIENPFVKQEEIIVVDKEETTRRLEKERSEIVAFLSEKNSSTASDSTKTISIKSETAEASDKQVSVQTIEQIPEMSKENAPENQTFVIESIETEEPEKESVIVNVIDAVVESVKEVSSTPSSETRTELKVVNSSSELFLELLNSESFYSTLRKIYDGVITRTQENS